MAHVPELLTHVSAVLGGHGEHVTPFQFHLSRQVHRGSCVCAAGESNGVSPGPVTWQFLHNVHLTSWDLQLCTWCHYPWVNSVSKLASGHWWDWINFVLTQKIIPKNFANSKFPHQTWALKVLGAWYQVPQRLHWSLHQHLAENISL